MAMQNAEWKNIKRILSDCLELEPSRRDEFLDGYDEETRAEIESLLAFETEAEDGLRMSAVEFSKDFFDGGENLLIGQNFGVYRAVRELGYGGMGAVYLAERTDGKFEQKVAIKMLKRELNSKKVRQSFEREKQIQSKLIHPFIARLLDAGTTADGVPFLVMEHIEGVPVDRFCKEKNLDITARLKLFNKICEAVAFAHRNLIIHRDLKASNILVSEDGTPKLLDFGISKLLGETFDENTATLFGAMTPQYASPEQIKGETITTATDIYSLGVILYKMLTGAFPHDFDGKANGEIFRTISETDPVKPSEIQNSKFKIQNSNSQLTTHNSQLLKGDLDNIILKALRKEPEQRYETVEQFSADIWRHIDGLPVAARPATLAYRLNKFFRRNKIAVTAAILIFVSLLTGIAVAFRQAKLANEQAQIAVESRNLAESETAKAKTEKEKSEKITRFMSKIIGYANPHWYAEGAKFGKDARVIDAIIDMGDRIDKEFANEPDVAAELHHRFTEAVGTNAGSLGAEQQKQIRIFHARRALELRKQFYGEKHELVAKDMAYLYWARGFDDPNRASYIMSAIQMMRETNPNNINLPYMLEDFTTKLIMPELEKYHEQYRNAVMPSTNESRYEIAEKMLRESLPVFRLHYKEDNNAIYAAECKLAYTLAMQEKWTDFNEHYTLCKNSGNFLKIPDAAKDTKWYVDWIEKALTEKKHSG